MADNNLLDKLFNLLKQFGVTWNTFNLAKHLVKNNVVLNERLTLDDLEDDMWVWNETKNRYQQVKYVYIPQDQESEHWCNEYDVIVENDELWRYKKESVENNE